MAPPAPTAPAFVRMAAHPLRWRLLTALAAGDHRVRELVDLLGHPQNLISYHLRLLRGSGLVTSRRSSFDARDSYYHLDLDRCADALAAAGAELHPALRLDPAPSPVPPPVPFPAPSSVPSSVPSSAPSPALSSATAGGAADRPRVLFACTGNSARSPIAAALLRHRGGGHVEVMSAGSHPKARMHPNAVRVLREEYGLDLAGVRPRHLDAVDPRRFSHLISLCDKVREAHPAFGVRPRPTHWSIPDPAATGGDDQASYPAFVDTARELDTRIRRLLPVLTPATPPEVPS